MNFDFVPNDAPARPVLTDKKIKKEYHQQNKESLENYRLSGNLSIDLLQAIVSQLERKLSTKEAELEAAHKEIRRLKSNSNNNNKTTTPSSRLSLKNNSFHNLECWSADDEDCAKKILSCPGLRSKQKLFLRQVLGTQAYARRHEQQKATQQEAVTTTQQELQATADRRLLKDSLARVTLLESVVEEKDKKIRRLEEAAAQREAAKLQATTALTTPAKSPATKKREIYHNNLLLKYTTESVREIVLAEAEAKSDQIHDELEQVIQERRRRRQQRHAR